MVRPQELDNPVTIRIPPNAVDGQMYRMSLAVVDEVGLPDELFVRVKIIRRRRVADGVSIFAALILVASLLLIFSGKSGNIISRLSGIFSDIKSIAPAIEEPLRTQAPSTPSVETIESEYAGTVNELVAELIPNYPSRYFLTGMNEDCLWDFCALYEAALNFEPVVNFPRGVNSDTLISMLTALQYECPELIMLDFSTSISYNYNQSNSMVTSVNLRYQLSREDYAVKYAQCVDVITTLKNATLGMSEAEKEKVVYCFFVSNCSYDMEAEYASSAYGALVEHVAKCDGFSLAFKWVLEELGMKCICLRGDPVQGDLGHAWNMVCLDGKYYSVDVTADIQSEENKREPLYVSYNTSSDWVGRYYTVSGGLELFRAIPVCSTMSRSYHVLNGTFVYSGQDASALFSSQLDSIRANGGYLMLQFESDTDREYFISNIEQYYEQWARNNGGPACTYSYTEMYNMLYLSLD